MGFPGTPGAPWMIGPRPGVPAAVVAVTPPVVALFQPVARRELVVSVESGYHPQGHHDRVQELTDYGALLVVVWVAGRAAVRRLYPCERSGD